MPAAGDQRQGQAADLGHSQTRLLLIGGVGAKGLPTSQKKRLFQLFEDVQTCVLSSCLNDLSRSLWTLTFFFFVAILACGSSWAWGTWELQLLVYTTGTATLDPSHIFDLCRRSLRILSPLSKARDRTHIFTDTVLGS